MTLAICHELQSHGICPLAASVESGRDLADVYRGAVRGLCDSAASADLERRPARGRFGCAGSSL